MIGIVDAIARLLANGTVAVHRALPPGTSVRRARAIPAIGGRLAGLGRPAAAVTVGRTILLHPSARLTDRLLRHELAHVAQWRARPWAFPFCYMKAHIRHGYQANPFELEARAAESGSGTTGETP